MGFRGLRLACDNWDVAQLWTPTHFFALIFPEVLVRWLIFSSPFLRLWLFSNAEIKFLNMGFIDIASLFLAKIVSKSATLIAPGTLQLKILNGHWAVGQLRSSDLQPSAFQVESNGSLPSQSRRMKGRSESRFFSLPWALAVLRKLGDRSQLTYF